MIEKQQQIAQVINGNLRHIIIKRDSYFPWVKSAAKTLCGTILQFNPSIFMDERKLSIQRHKLKMCVDCMELTQEKEIAKFEKKKAVVNNVTSIRERLLSTRSKIPEYYGGRRGEKENGQK